MTEGFKMSKVAQVLLLVKDYASTKDDQLLPVIEELITDDPACQTWSAITEVYVPSTLYSFTQDHT
jgi:hypothetical protein